MQSYDAVFRFFFRFTLHVPHKQKKLAFTDEFLESKS